MNTAQPLVDGPAGAGGPASQGASNDKLGWHGKLPSLGDFASRRLGADFIEPWDSWLAQGLLDLRQARPESWLADYLASPSWRFLLMPGVLPGAAGQQAWAGVLMPSVDKVGRYFPLTLAQGLGPGPASTQQMQALWFWLGRVDELARDALYDDWAVERLEQELATMAGPDLPALASPTVLWPLVGELLDVALAPGLDAATLIGVEAQKSWAAQAHGRAWWFAKPDEGAPQLRLSLGLPRPAALGHLFGHLLGQALPGPAPVGAASS